MRPVELDGEAAAVGREGDEVHRIERCRAQIEYLPALPCGQIERPQRAARIAVGRFVAESESQRESVSRRFDLAVLVGET